jgi:hypothetical protein
MVDMIIFSYDSNLLVDKCVLPAHFACGAFVYMVKGYNTLLLLCCHANEVLFHNRHNEWRLDETKSSNTHPLRVLFITFVILTEMEIKVSISQVFHLEVENRMSETYILYCSSLQLLNLTRAIT